ncbi:iron chelate uptake ABC transporter family permease subunit [uncultured Helcococcus sp.]|uniref:iron chelate uptake ABC transporter family permease subunit n=1 Tax=uncultured Helcococcus sp. TaxID=1072508 RepID=UPI00288B7011|nr:iron chelate uptake ABC transporter family permease subunit [uncultured Helcococcus sp.]
MRDISFRTSKEKQKYFMILSILIFLTLVSIYGLLTYNNPVAIDSPSFLPVIKRRQNAIIAMLIAATCHAFATLLFQTVTNNRIITPSLLGFEAVYSTINTATMYFLGINSFIALSGITFYLSQIGIMILISLLLFSTLLKKDRGVDFLLLVGIIMGQGLRSISAFMRRLLSPSEFDVLQAKLFASVNNSDSSYFLISAILVVLVVGIIFSRRSKLNVIGLGSSASTNLGIDYKKTVIYSLIGISILMSVSTALIGPMNFFGFLIVSLTYEFANTYDHKYLFMMALFLAFFILTTSYFIMNHIFNANGVVSILIELVGGLYFIYIVFRKGKR